MKTIYMKNAALSQNAARKNIFLFERLGDFSSKKNYTLKII